MAVLDCLLTTFSDQAWPSHATFRQVRGCLAGLGLVLLASCGGVTVIDSTSAIESQDIVQHPSKTAPEVLGAVERYRLGVQLESEGKFIKAIEHYEYSALLGDQTAQKKLAEYYDVGEVVPRDYRRAYLYYKLYFLQDVSVQYRPEVIKRKAYIEAIHRLGSQLSKEDRIWIRKETIRHNKAASEWAAHKINNNRK